MYSTSRLFALILNYTMSISDIQSFQRYQKVSNNFKSLVIALLVIVLLWVIFKPRITDKV